MNRTSLMTDLAPYAAVFKDIATRAPDLHASLSRDYQRLEKVVSTRGTSFTMIDMPEVGKQVDVSLSRGWFDFLSLPHTFGKIKDRDREYFLKGLLLKVFTSEGHLRKDVDVQHIRWLRQVLYMAKKVDLPCSDAAVDAAVLDFVRIDNELRSPSYTWDLDQLTADGLSKLSFLDGYRTNPDLVSHRDTCPRPLVEVLDRVCETVSQQFPMFDSESVVPRHGPGAVSDVKSGNDKYSFPNWPRKLDLIFGYERYAQHREDLHLYDDKDTSPKEPPARLCAVPKTLKGPRLITVEPVAHQFLQQGLLQWLRRNLPKSMAKCIDFRSQEPSRDAARFASLLGDVATVDLSSASDRLSCWIVERMFHGNSAMGILSALHAVRSRWVEYIHSDTKNYLVLRKYAGQGNATTFPVQSIYYACVAIASVLYESGKPVTLKTISAASERIRVFGDDIILPSPAVRSLVDLLTYTGMKVNMGKTHVRGHFRESCGMDAYQGVDVTPVYIRDLQLGKGPEKLVSWIDVINNAYSRGYHTLGDWMKDQVPEEILKLIPTSGKTLGCLTLRNGQEGLQHSSRLRYNVHLQRLELLALQVVTQTAKLQRRGHESLLQFFLEKPEPDIYGVIPVWSSGYHGRNRLRLRKRWVPLS